MSESIKLLQDNQLPTYSNDVARRLLETLNTVNKIKFYIRLRFNGVFLISLIERLIEMSPNLITANALRQNLMEEKGEITAYGQEDHEASRKDLANAVGVKLDPALPEDISEILSSKGFMFLMGIFVYIEYQVPNEYEALLNLVRANFLVKEEDVYHLVNHITHDEFHFQDIIMRLINTRNLNTSDIIEGINFMHQRRISLVKIIERLEDPTHQSTTANQT